MQSGMRWQVGLIAAVFAIVVVVSLPIYPYRWHLLLHILGAIVFVGNIVVTAMWMALAERTREPSVIHFASKSVSRADVLFTGPGVTLVLLNGLALAADRWGGWTGFYNFSWIVASLGLFAVSGVVWAGFLLPYQMRLARLSTPGPESRSELPSEFFEVLHRWYLR